MTIGVQTFRGARLKEARLSRGLYKKSLADMVGLTGTAITRFEDGSDKPHKDNLSALATKLSFPVEFFLRDAWSEDLGVVFWRSQASETMSAREMTEQRMRWTCEVVSFLEEEVNFPPLNLPDLDLPTDFRSITPEAIERCAIAVRARMGFRNRPIPDVILALENIGIPVIQLEIVSDKQDGFCFWSNKLGRFFVGLNTHNVSCARARFDAAHEFGHALLHRLVTPEEAEDRVTHNLMEQQAHRFASAFLFPAEAFLAEVSVVSLDYFCALKKRWGISIGAMIFRAYDLGLIGKEEKTVLFRNMTRRGWRGPLREPLDTKLDMPLERPRMLRRGIETVCHAGIFGRDTIKSVLALPEQEIEQIAGLSKGFFGQSDPISFPVAARERGFRAVDLESGNILEFPKSTRK